MFLWRLHRNENPGLSCYIMVGDAGYLPDTHSFLLCSKARECDSHVKSYAVDCWRIPFVQVFLAVALQDQTSGALEVDFFLILYIKPLLLGAITTFSSLFLSFIFIDKSLLFWLGAA